MVASSDSLIVPAGSVAATHAHATPSTTPTPRRWEADRKSARVRGRAGGGPAGPRSWSVDRSRLGSGARGPAVSARRCRAARPPLTMDASSAASTFHALPVQRNRTQRGARGRRRRLRERPDGAERRRPADPKEDSAGRSASPHASASSGTQPTTRNGHGMPEKPGVGSSRSSGAAAGRRGRVEFVDAFGAGAEAGHAVESSARLGERVEFGDAVGAGAEAGHAVEVIDAFGASAEAGHAVEFVDAFDAGAEAGHAVDSSARLGERRPTTERTAKNATDAISQRAQGKPRRAGPSAGRRAGGS